MCVRDGLHFSPINLVSFRLPFLVFLQFDRALYAWGLGRTVLCSLHLFGRLCYAPFPFPFLFCSFLLFCIRSCSDLFCFALLAGVALHQTRRLGGGGGVSHGALV